MKLQFSTAFHPQIDGQSERVIQILSGSWDDHLHLVKFAYYNSYQATMQISPFEALYGRKCRPPLHWDKVCEKALLEPGLVQHAIDKIQVVKQRMKAAQD